MFEEGMYLSVFYFLCFVQDVLMGMLKEQKREERDPDLKVEKYVMCLYERKNHWKDVLEENHQDKGEVYPLMWEVYIKEKQELLMSYFSMAVPHLKIGNIVWTSVEDNIINEKEEYKAIRLHGFNYSLFEEE